MTAKQHAARILGLVAWSAFVFFVVPRLPIAAQFVIYAAITLWVGYTLGVTIERGRRIKDSIRYGQELARLREIMDETIAGLREGAVNVDRAFAALEQRARHVKSELN